MLFRQVGSMKRDDSRIPIFVQRNSVDARITRPPLRTRGDLYRIWETVRIAPGALPLSKSPEGKTDFR